MTSEFLDIPLHLLVSPDGCFVSGSLSGEMVVWSGVSLVALQKIKVDEDTPGKCLEHNSQPYPSGIYYLSSSRQVSNLPALWGFVRGPIHSVNSEDKGQHIEVVLCLNF